MTSPRLAIIVACIFCSVLISSSRADDKPLTFEADIQPLLSRRCSKCHSQKVRKGGLDLSSMDGLRRGGESGEAVVVEEVDDSLLWIMIDGGDMPPKGEAPLTDKERTLIRRWIADGSRSKNPAKREITQHDVLPIVLLRCTTCHGPRRKNGGLDLRTADGSSH